MLLTTKESKAQLNFSDLDQLTFPAEKHLKKLNEFIQSQVDNFEAEIQEVVSYCLKSGGKRLRALLLFYSGWTDETYVAEELVKAATVIEFIHLATLVHDDILDNADLRHNRSTVSERYGSAVAVLIGDAIFSQSLKLASEFPTVDVCAAVSQSTRRVCSGEIAQNFLKGNSNISIDDYYRIINQKTAELFRVSAYLGAHLSNYDKAFINAVEKFGEHLGIAYQIYDDTTDIFGSEDKVGKTLGTDLAEGKITLPLILLGKKLNSLEKTNFNMNIFGNNSISIENIIPKLKELNIHTDVQHYFNKELKLANTALADFENLPPVKHLLNLSNYLNGQMKEILN